MIVSDHSSSLQEKTRLATSQTSVEHSVDENVGISSYRRLDESAQSFCLMTHRKMRVKRSVQSPMTVFGDIQHSRTEIFGPSFESVQIKMILQEDPTSAWPFLITGSNKARHPCR